MTKSCKKDKCKQMETHNGDKEAHKHTRKKNLDNAK